MEKEKINKAIEALQPIVYEPHPYGYYVLKNKNDMGGSDYCKSCINAAVKSAREFHRTQRARIIKKYEDASKNNRFKQTELRKWKRMELKEYPFKANFTYAWHDPDFGGGLYEPCTCDGCGEPFACQFTPNKDEAEHLSHIIKCAKLSDRDKWELEIALNHYQYSQPDVRIVLEFVAEQILNYYQNNSYVKN